MYDQNWNQIWAQNGASAPIEVDGIQGRAPWWSPSGTAIAYETILTPDDLYNPFLRTDVQPGFSCSDGRPAAMFAGVNTWRLTFSATPAADMIAVGATPSGNGIAFIGGANQSGVFAISTVNIGAATQLTGRVRFSDPSLPLTATVCETNPTTAECKQSPGPSVTRTFDHNETATFTVFLKASGTIPPDFANNRVLLEFVDTDGVVRGSTSAAVATDN